MHGRFLALGLRTAGLFALPLCIGGNGTERASRNAEESAASPKDPRVERDSAQSQLAGLWQCYKQQDRAKLPSCLYSIEFFPDGTMVQKTNVDGYSVVLRCGYSIEGKRIIVKTLPAAWRFDFRLLENGDLYLHKAPWNWKGWLTKDSTKVPQIMDVALSGSDSSLVESESPVSEQLDRRQKRTSLSS